MNAILAGLGHALPEHSFSQPQATRFGVECLGYGRDAARLSEAIHRRSAIQRRGSVIIVATAPEGHPIDQEMFRASSSHALAPGTADRMRWYGELAPRLALQAATAALRDADVRATRVTHLITASCTGFGAPGVDIQLIVGLGLSPDVQRTNIGYMGCHAAINALRVARALVIADPLAVVLVVCVELCTLHLQRDARPDSIVANALFADGAASCVVASSDAIDGTMARSDSRPLDMLDTASHVIPESKGAMRWDIGDHGFVMSLSESVPELIRLNLAAWLGPWLRSRPETSALAPAELTWAVHPGGPKVLHAVQDAMGLPSSALEASAGVLRDCGNMSSATSLVIVERLRARGAAGPIVVIAFGPGLCVEVALLRS